MKKNRIPHKFFINLLFISALLMSCGNSKDVVYFQNLNRNESLQTANDYSYKFSKGDILSIYVSTLVPEASIPYNLTSAVSQSGGSDSTQSIDYLVDTNGNIDFPVLGPIHVEGLTAVQLKETLKKQLINGDHLKDPIINVRLTNFKVTVLGEVRNPGTFNVPSDKVSILEALGLAGDLTIKGKRDNVLIIREKNGLKTTTRVDLTNKNIISNPAFYLAQNDVIYVEPNQSAVSQSVTDNRLTIGISIVSLLVSTAFFILK